jgi:LemA protein
MTFEQLLVAGIAALLFFWALGAHNRVVALRNGIGAAWQQVDVALQQRATALAALISGARLHLPQHQEMLDAVLVAQAHVQAAADAMRARPTRAAHAEALVLADASLTHAQASVSGVLDTHGAWREDGELTARLATLQEAIARLAFARQLFNEAVRVYNAAARQFPTSLLSRLFGFAPAGEL